jgi:hypothetical protein
MYSTLGGILPHTEIERSSRLGSGLHHPGFLRGGGFPAVGGTESLADPGVHRGMCIAVVRAQVGEQA